MNAPQTGKHWATVMTCLEVPHSVWTTETLLALTGIPPASLRWLLLTAERDGRLMAETVPPHWRRGRPRKLYRLVGGA